MRIISDFKDYYDGVMAYGVDQERVYVRKQQEVFLEDANFQGWDFTEHHIGVHAFVVGVAGKMYPCVKMGCYQWFGAAYRRLDDIGFDFDRVQKFIQEARDKNFISKKELEWWQKHHLLPQFFADIEAIKDKHLAFFVEHRTPVFVVDPTDRQYREQDKHGKYTIGKRNRRIVLNASLKDVAFFRVMDAFAVFQEISMFISNYLTEKPPDPKPIPDEVMRDMKGFDEHSFKKGPTKKRP